MDINSLLSPQESPRGTPAPPPPVKSSSSPKKPRKSRRASSKLGNRPQASQLSQSSLPPTSSLPQAAEPYNLVMQAQHATSSPPNVGPAPTLHKRNADTPPTDGRLSRQPSTPGMDTLADLATMQHHQQTARVNAGGLRDAALYDKSTSIVSALSSGQNAGNVPGHYASDSAAERSFDCAVGDASLQSERSWVEIIKDQVSRASSLEDCIPVMELCKNAVDQERTSTKLWSIYGDFYLTLYKSANPQDKKLENFETERNGWSDEDRMLAGEIFTWQQMMEIWRCGASETMWCIHDSHLVWDRYIELLLEELAESPSQEAVAIVQEQFLLRLETPHAKWDQTFQTYSTFISRYDDGNYEAAMVMANSLGAVPKAIYNVRESWEAEVQDQQNKQDGGLSIFKNYLEWEMSPKKPESKFEFELANALYQRITSQFPDEAEIWEGYVMFLTENITQDGPKSSVLPVLDKATRHCPWSGNLWSLYLLEAETNGMSFIDVSDIKHRATSTGSLDAEGMNPVLSVYSAWCNFLRRRAFKKHAPDEDLDVAEVGMRSAMEDMETLGCQKYGREYQGDPEYRLEKIFIKYLTQRRNWTGARQTFEKLVSRRGDSYDFWMQYYHWEMSTWCKRAFGETNPNGGSPIMPTEATRVLQKAMGREALDWPERIIETFLCHCEHHEDAKVLQRAMPLIYHARDTTKKRREKENLEAYEAAQSQMAQKQKQYAAAGPDETQNIGKRKREETIENGPSKKRRPQELVDAETQVQHHEHELAVPPFLATSSQLKRDRENTTVEVTNLPASTTETRIKQYFKDCGKINAIKLLSEGDTETAFIEFQSQDDVLTASTRNLKNFGGNEIEVQVRPGSTLYVCNFPPEAHKTWILDRFKQYGQIIDVRFPSLKYNTHRRFCYVWFRLPSQAEAAAQLDGEDLGGDLKLIARLSDPEHKKDRSGALAEGREVFIKNLPWEAVEKDIEEFFSKHGSVENVRIPRKINNQSKGIAFVTFQNADSATAALEMNGEKFPLRVLEVSVASNNIGAKRQATQIIRANSHRNSYSPSPSVNASTNGDAPDAASPDPPAGTKPAKSANIQSRRLALINIGDDVSLSHIRSLAEPYGELAQVSLRPEHKGAILEYEDVASVGKASLALEGYEIESGRRIRVGTVSEMMQRGKPNDARSTTLQGPAPIRRPNPAGARLGGRRGGLGIKSAGLGFSEDKPTKYGEGRKVETTSRGEGGQAHKSNADFKALFNE